MNFIDQVGAALLKCNTFIHACFDSRAYRLHSGGASTCASQVWFLRALVSICIYF